MKFPKFPFEKELGKGLVSLLLIISLLPFSISGQAVITLVMPVGARQLGMGETAVAVADDVYTTFWNPAGLAFGPLADEWGLALSSKESDELIHDFTTLGSKQKKSFLSKATLWSGTKDGLVHFNGKVWKEYHEYVMTQEDEIKKVVREYAGTEDNLDTMVQIVKDYNKVKTKEDEQDLISLRLPYNLVFYHQEVSTILVDKTHRVWVGTPKGLYRFDGEKWKNFRNDDSFKGSTPEMEKSRDITCLALKGSEIWVGTKNGLFRYRKTKFVRRGKNQLPSQHVTAMATHPDSREIYIAIKNKGIARYTPSKGKGRPAKWRLFSVNEGLLDSSVNNLVQDKYGHVWVGHPGGVSHYSLTEWQRITFNKQKVHSIDLGKDGSIWIGTDKGVWKHRPHYTHPKGRKKSKQIASSDPKKGDWFHYHTGNALVDNNDLVIETQGDDVWFVTSAGVERYDAAKSQVGLFYESLLPALEIKDLFHAFLSTTFPLQEWGTVGGFINFISFGEIDMTNEMGETTESFTSTETVGAVSYGTKLTKNTGFGLNIKFIYSALAPEISAPGEETDGVAASYAVDLGYLWRNIYFPGVSLGFVMQNIGPAVFYVDKDQSDPIPFTWKLGAAYEFSTPHHKLVFAGDANREAVYYESGRRGATPVYIGAWKDLVYPFGDEDKNHGNLDVWEENIRKMVFNAGAEYTYANVISFRLGYLFDESGQREELDFGVGFLLSDILQIDATYINDLGGGIRNGQKRFSLVFKF
ncbi:PorV/PorQ family protein [Fibrobacterota bacterium]